MARTKGLYKRGNIYWLRYAGLDGKLVYESSRSDKFRDAEGLLVKRRKAIQEGKQPDIKRIANYSFKDLVAEYTKWMERQRSFRSKHCNIGQLNEVFGNVPLRRFNTMLVEQFQTDRLQKGNKPSTTNRLLALIKHMFSKAVEWEMVEEDILKRIRKARLLQENNRRLRFLTKEECHVLTAACSEHLKPIVIAALNTGMRRGEILSLKWEMVDLKHGFILLDVTKNGSRREIPINGTLRTTLTAIPRSLDIPWVFHDPITGKPYGDIKHSFHGACRRAGINDFHFHDLRHTFASHLVMSGVDLTTVSRLLGHKDLTMTLRYSHLSPLHMTKAVDILDRAYNETDIIIPVMNYTKNRQSMDFEGKESLASA